MPEIKPNQIAASNILVESIKLIFTISTVYIGAFFAYAQNANRGWLFWMAISLLTATSILSIWVINIIVNQIWDNSEQNIMANSVRISFVAVAFLLFLGIGTSLYHIQESKSYKTNESHLVSPSSVIIKDGEVVVTDSSRAKIKIEKTNGVISVISINQ
jgi:hypothetical protein